MDIKGNGVEVRVNPADQSDEWLISAAQEITTAAQERGLLLPLAAGAVAIEGAQQEAVLAIEAHTLATKESLSKQLLPALKGYQSVANAINNERRNKDMIPMATDEVLTTEFNAWLTEDKLAYVRAAQEADPELRFTLVAAPNVLAKPNEIIKAAKLFGNNQPYETYVWDELYGKYSPQELSGTNPDNGNTVQFSLIPSKLDEKLYATVEKQRTALVELQKTNPDLKIPSVLEAITYWNTLRAQNGDTLPADDGNFDKTFIRHFDLPERRFGGWSGVPGSYVGGDGRPNLDYSSAGHGGDARVSVG